VRDRDDDAAAADMIGHDIRKQGPRGGIKRNGWFVQEPERSWRAKQTRQSEPSFLTGGKVSGRNVLQRGKTKPLGGIGGMFRFTVEEAVEERQILGHGQGGLDPVQMTDIVALLADASVVVSFRERHRPMCDWQQASDAAQQGCLARAVRTDHRKRMTGLHHEVKAGKDDPVPAPRRKILDYELCGWSLYHI